MKLDSKVNTLEKSAKFIFESLENIGNFEKLMPENLQKFSVLNEKSFSFALQGMPEISLVRTNSEENKKIVFNALDGKIPFTLTILLSEISENTCEISFHFEGNFNPMMALMVKTPIAKFIDTLANKATLL